VLRTAKVWTEPDPKPKHPTAEPNPDPQPPTPTPNPQPPTLNPQPPTLRLAPTQGPTVARAAGPAARARDYSLSGPRVGAGRLPASVPPAARRARRARLGKPGRSSGWRDERVVAVLRSAHSS
jgi:hypothetical protein